MGSVANERGDWQLLLRARRREQFQAGLVRKAIAVASVSETGVLLLMQRGKWSLRKFCSSISGCRLDSILPLSVGCRGWNRTSIPAFKGHCSTIRRHGNE